LPHSEAGAPVARLPRGGWWSGGEDGLAATTGELSGHLGGGGEAHADATDDDRGVGLAVDLHAAGDQLLAEEDRHAEGEEGDGGDVRGDLAGLGPVACGLGGDGLGVGGGGAGGHF